MSLTDGGSSDRPAVQLHHIAGCRWRARGRPNDTVEFEAALSAGDLRSAVMAADDGVSGEDMRAALDQWMRDAQRRLVLDDRLVGLTANLLADLTELLQTDMSLPGDANVGGGWQLMFGRLIGLVVLVFLGGALASWLAAQPGMLAFEWFGWQVEMRTSHWLWLFLCLRLLPFYLLTVSCGGC